MHLLEFVLERVHLLLDEVRALLLRHGRHLLAHDRLLRISNAGTVSQAGRHCLQAVLWYLQNITSRNFDTDAVNNMT